jgi:hypothetical protein
LKYILSSLKPPPQSMAVTITPGPIDQYRYGYNRSAALDQTESRLWEMSEIAGSLGSRLESQAETDLF